MTETVAGGCQTLRARQIRSRRRAPRQQARTADTFGVLRGLRTAAIWSLALAMGSGGCSTQSGPSAAVPATQPSTNTVASGSTLSSSPTATAPGFKQDPVDAAFAKKMEALCNDWNSFASTHQYPGAANPQAATVEELPKIGAWIDSLPINHDLVTRAAGLGTPAAGATAWARVLVDFARYEKSVAAAAAAAKAGNLQAGNQPRNPGRQPETLSVKTS